MLDATGEFTLNVSETAMNIRLFVGHWGSWSIKQSPDHPLLPWGQDAICEQIGIRIGFFKENLPTVINILNFYSNTSTSNRTHNYCNIFFKSLHCRFGKVQTSASNPEVSFLSQKKKKVALLQLASPEQRGKWGCADGVSCLLGTFRPHPPFPTWDHNNHLACWTRDQMAFEVQKRYVLSLFKISSGKPLVHHKEMPFTSDNTLPWHFYVKYWAESLSIGGRKLLLLVRPFFTHLKCKILEAAWLGWWLEAVTYYSRPRGAW